MASMSGGWPRFIKTFDEWREGKARDCGTKGFSGNWMDARTGQGGHGNGLGNGRRSWARLAGQSPGGDIEILFEECDPGQPGHQRILAPPSHVPPGQQQRDEPVGGQAPADCLRRHLRHRHRASAGPPVWQWQCASSRATTCQSSCSMPWSPNRVSGTSHCAQQYPPLGRPRSPRSGQMRAIPPTRPRSPLSAAYCSPRGPSTPRSPVSTIIQARLRPRRSDDQPNTSRCSTASSTFTCSSSASRAPAPPEAAFSSLSSAAN